MDDEEEIMTGEDEPIDSFGFIGIMAGTVAIAGDATFFLVITHYIAGAVILVLLWTEMKGILPKALLILAFLLPLPLLTLAVIAGIAISNSKIAQFLAQQALEVGFAAATGGAGAVVEVAEIAEAGEAAAAAGEAAAAAAESAGSAAATAAEAAEQGATASAEIGEAAASGAGAGTEAGESLEESEPSTDEKRAEEQKSEEALGEPKKVMDKVKDELFDQVKQKLGFFDEEEDDGGVERDDNAQTNGSRVPTEIPSPQNGETIGDEELDPLDSSAEAGEDISSEVGSTNIPAEKPSPVVNLRNGKSQQTFSPAGAPPAGTIRILPSKTVIVSSREEALEDFERRTGQALPGGAGASGPSSRGLADMSRTQGGESYLNRREREKLEEREKKEDMAIKNRLERKDDADDNAQQPPLSKAA